MDDGRTWSAQVHDLLGVRSAYRLLWRAPAQWIELRRLSYRLGAITLVALALCALPDPPLPGEPLAALAHPASWGALGYLLVACAGMRWPTLPARLLAVLCVGMLAASAGGVLAGPPLDWQGLATAALHPIVLPPLLAAGAGAALAACADALHGARVRRRAREATRDRALLRGERVAGA